MCGICGFIDFKGQLDRETLLKMTDVLHHRGPDGEGHEMWHYNSTQIGFGHKRLSIIDLSEGGKQPKSKQGWHITFNGEIYNYREIKQTLEQLGHEFSSNSDTEVILSAFIEWGPKCAEQFIGMFAFVIYNEKQKVCYVFRDRAGVKPLYYHSGDDMFVFSSELKSFHEVKSLKKELNNDALAYYLRHGYVASPHSIFKGIHKLTPGHYLKIDLTSKTIDEVTYWDVSNYYNQPPLQASEEEILEELDGLMTSAFQYRMVSDVPVGVFLSGGYDSALVTAILQQNSSKPIHTFTIGFEEAKFNEAVYAEEVAAYLGTDHQTYYCSHKEALDIIPELPFYYDEPSADSSAIPTTLVSKMARNKVTVALSADGGDELFAGYARNVSLKRYYDTRTQIPGIIGKLGAYSIKGILSLLPTNLGSFRQKKLDKIAHSLEIANISPSEFLGIYSQFLTDRELKVLLTKSYDKLTSAYDDKRIFSGDPLNTILNTEYKVYMAEDILVKVDRASMSVSLEAREPFLDHRLIEYISRIPSDMKYKNGELKYLEKQITHRYLPEKMMDRPKQGFGIPLMSWLKKDLKDYIYEYLDETKLKDQGLFNVKRLIKERDQFMAGEQVNHYEWLWSIIHFNAWHDKWC